MRRLYIGLFSPGKQSLAPEQAHYLRDVLRMGVGDTLEVFDGQGSAAPATITQANESGVMLQVGPAVPSAISRRQVVVASATPKGNRADWMVEKLAELGVAQFIPLKTERTIVLPEGQGKSSRWQRISQEASRQSGRSDVMEIGSLMTLAACLDQIKSAGATGWILSTQAGAVPVMEAVGQANSGISHRAAEPQRRRANAGISHGDTEPRRKEIANAVNNGTNPVQGEEIGPVPSDQNPTKLRVSVSPCEIPDLYLLIGPEGGWTDRELALATARGVRPVRLTQTVLRIETAAIAAATVACSCDE